MVKVFLRLSKGHSTGYLGANVLPERECFMDGLNLEALPDLPQRPLLLEVACDLWADPTVAALWLGGSLARGAGDAHSDVDLRVALAPPAGVSEAIPASAHRLTARITYHLTLRFAEDAVLHHLLLDDGQIYDLWVQTAAREPSREARLMLGCRDEALASKLAGGEDPSVRFEPADPEEIKQVIGGFWMTLRKHRKVLARGLTLIAWEGEHRIRQDLLRLWHVEATGRDCGPMSTMTIHSLTPMVRTVEAAHDSQALKALGRSSETEVEFGEATERLRAEGARVGRLLAGRLGFEYPAAAEEAAVR